jgi:membrane protein implicated in regulation of membrane protease activity
VSVGVRLSERTLLTLFLVPVTVLAVAGIVAPLRDIASFITRYQWYLTLITFLLVAVSLGGQGRRGRGPVETVDELHEELACAERELEGEAPVRDAR